MRNFYKKSLLLLTGLFFSVLTFAQTFENGVFVLNEGGFGYGNASVSVLTSTGFIENNAFSTQNSGAALGDVAQSMAFEGDYLYIVVNYSNYVKVVNRNTLALVATISDQMSNPRNIAFYNGKGYVTNWGDGSDVSDDYVAVIDLATNTVTETISVVEGPEEIVEHNGILFVAHQGGYGFGNSVSVIDTATNSVESIAVGDVPSSLEVDATNLYVLCSGSPNYNPTGETTGSLFKIDLTDYTNKTAYAFAGLSHPELLVLDTTSLYYVLGNEVFKMALSDTALPSTSFIDLSTEGVQNPYSMEKIENRLYIGDAISYTSESKLFIYGNDGSFVNNYDVGILPSGIYYNDQPYAPVAGQPGSTAIPAASELFVAWANGAEVTRGHVDIANPETEYQGNAYASFGTPESALGTPNNSPVSLGDAGEAIVTFALPITNGEGYDFAVFENGFSNTFLELAFVEVSSDGINYFRFPSHSKTQTTTQIGGFGSVDATKLNNLAGKYRANFGTPFDISDIADNELLDKTSITHVKLVDVVGTINPLYAGYDSLGNIINELYATPFNSGGFDLDAVGVINQKDISLSVAEKQNAIGLYPNPASSELYVSKTGTMAIYSVTGALVLQKELIDRTTPVSLDGLHPGVYIVKLSTTSGVFTQKLVKK
ncbi:DUF5074 domain-containing protein [Algibacter miyuki]|uniref:DUF5074 domain-containing protein n=1 Tax=Algibacter miyuki TaxID=1306933 RepID=A0ABV5H434_9FLAO|nr:DUF5074 domain-containing protein [Algibacter miyuki]MDN3665707.1 T9SS type A sorting domain-containing protein [Algibacter miyuki]